MQDTLYITGVGDGYDFTWLYTLETSCSILVQRKDTAQVYNIIFLSNFLLVYTKNVYNQRGFSNITLHNCQLAKVNANNEGTHNHGRREGGQGEKVPRILQFDIFLLNVQQKKVIFLV